MKINKLSLLVVLVVCSVVLTSCVPKLKKEEIVESQKQEQSDEETFNGSLKQLIGAGKTAECSFQFNNPDGNGATTGLVYVDGVRSRSEIRVRAEGREETNTINMDLISVSDGEMAYMWDEGQKTGTKYNIAEMEKLGKEMQEGQENTDQNQVQKNWEEMYDYRCKKWRVDESKFNIPTDIEFTDMMEQMKQAQEQMEDLKQSMQGVCDNLPEPQKSQCIDAME